MALTEAQKALAESFLKAQSAKWQTIQRGQWTYQFHGSVLVRCLRNVRMREDEVKAALAYLVSSDCVNTLSLYDQSIDATWRPIRAWLETSQGGVGNVAAVNLFHALRISPDDGVGDGPYVLEKGCAYNVEVTYYWSQATVMDVPQSTSGVHYVISGLNRDQDTGLYSYALEKRTRVQQDIAFTSRNDALTKSDVEQHNGVKEANQAQYTGKVGVSGDGTVTEASVSKNADCTADIGLHKTQRKANTETAESSSDTIYEHRDETRTQAKSAPLDGIEASGGVVHSVSSQKQADGKWDVSDSVRTEKTVECASVEVRRSLRGERTVTTDRSATAPASTAGLAVGESVQNTKTEGGLWNRVVAKFKAVAAGVIRSSCSATIFSHTHSTTTNYQIKPTDGDHVSAGGGVVRERTVTHTEDDTYDVNESIRTDKPVASVEVRKRRTLRGMVETTMSRNVSLPAETPQGYGDEAYSQKTDSGLYNTSEKKLPHQGAGLMRHAEHDTKLYKEISDVKNETQNNGSGASSSDGVIESKSASRNEDGTWDNTTTIRSAKPIMMGPFKWTNSVGDTDLKHSLTIYRNQRNVPDAPEGDWGSVTISPSINEFGLIDCTVLCAETLASIAIKGSGASQSHSAYIVNELKRRHEFHPSVKGAGRYRLGIWYEKTLRTILIDTNSQNYVTNAMKVLQSDMVKGVDAPSIKGGNTFVYYGGTTRGFKVFEGSNAEDAEAKYQDWVNQISG